MFFGKSLSIVTFLFVFSTRKNAALLMNGNSNLTSIVSTGNYLNLTEIMEILQNQTAELRKLKQQTENDRSTIQLLQNRVFFLEAGMKNLNTSNDIENLKVEVKYTSRSLLGVHSKTELLNTTLRKALNDGISDVTEQIAKINRKVAFTVGVSSSSSSWSSGTLVFPRVVYNIGAGYDPNTGVFTAPVDGHFVFFATLQSYGGNYVYTYLVLNGIPKVLTLADRPDFSSGSNLAVLRLQKEDRVWFKHFRGTGYYTEGAAPITTFSGFLI